VRYWEGEDVSCNKVNRCSLVKLLAVANLSGVSKPSADGEATGVCNHRAVRGKVGWRASKVVSGTWETPRSGLSGGPSKRRSGRAQRGPGIHNRLCGFAGESGGLIVVTTPGNAGISEGALPWELPT
jgi:hypothetical protein